MTSPIAEKLLAIAAEETKLSREQVPAAVSQSPGSTAEQAFGAWSSFANTSPSHTLNNWALRSWHT